MPDEVTLLGTTAIVAGEASKVKSSTRLQAWGVLTNLGEENHRIWEGGLCAMHVCPVLENLHRLRADDTHSSTSPHEERGPSGKDSADGASSHQRWLLVRRQRWSRSARLPLKGRWSSTPSLLMLVVHGGVSSGRGAPPLGVFPALSLVSEPVVRASGFRVSSA